jgi:Rrf2 family protein
VRINKEVEYALMSLLAMDEKGRVGLSSSREISERFKIPSHLLAKVLQKLGREGLIRSAQGPGGGYELSRTLDDITVADVVEIFQPSKVVPCLDADYQCSQAEHCNIKGSAGTFQALWDSFLASLTVRSFSRLGGSPKVAIVGLE